jgi:hypothetical protein
VGSCVGTLAEQSNGKLIKGDKAAIEPYSVSNFLAQTKKVVPNNTGGLTLRSIDGKAPTVVKSGVKVINPGFSATFLRLVYNVAKNTEIASNPNINALFAKGGYVCKQTTIIKKYGFGSLGAACGSTS